MKIREIRLENVRRFIAPVQITGIEDGLNVLTAPNEQGKSTFFDALHAVFFKDRKSWDRDIRGLVPYAGGDPAVTVEIELPKGIFRIEKRWNNKRNGEVRIISEGRLIKQADDAQVWIADMLKSPRDGGPAGLLWVRQGQSGLDEGDDTHSARRHLLMSVAGEVEAMTGGRRMDMVRDKCSKALERYLTATRRVKSDGPLKRAEDNVAELQRRREELEGKSNNLREGLERRREFKRQLAVLDDPEEVKARKRRLTEAELAHTDAQRHHERLERAVELERAKGVERDRTADKLAVLERNITESREANSALVAAKKDEKRQNLALRAVELKALNAEQSFDATHRNAESATNVLQSALRVQASVAKADRRKELDDRLKRAEKLRRRLEEMSADAKKEISARDLDEIERLDNDLRVIKRTRNFEAATITMQYVEGCEGEVLLDGAALPNQQTMPIPDGAELKIERIGQLVIRPAQKGEDGSVPKGEAKLAEALNASGFESVVQARDSGRRRRQVEEQGRDAQANYKSVAPEGIRALREQIALLSASEETRSDLPTVEAAQEAEDNAKIERANAHALLERCRTELADAQTKASHAAAALEHAKGRRDRAVGLISSLEDSEAEKRRLTTEAQEIILELREATRKREQISANVPDLEAAQATLQRAQSAINRAETETQNIRIALSGLDAMIDLLAGEAVEEELSDITMQADDAKRALDEMKFEVAVLLKIERALESARASALDRYVEPVLKELEPLVRLLWPEAVLRIDADAVLPAALEREGMEEKFEVLSGGTQEQIALLVRLAFARMLARGGAPAPVILDDAIVFTDDDRIERIFDVLTRQAKDTQIIVLSCRQRAFQVLGGRGLEIIPADRVL